jgi:uncharacterized membrane protein
LLFHITAGGFGLIFGATALFARKGAWLHRRAGSVFFIAMLLMSASGALYAVVKPAAAYLNVVVATVTFYLVTTSWMTVQRKAGEIGAFEKVAPLAALAAGVGGLIFGLEATNSANGRMDGIPAAPYFFFGAVGLFAAALDVSVILRRGVSGAQRIARHLWRMGLALLIAALAFFLGQGAKVFPAGLRETKIQFAPLIVVLVLTVFWLLRVLLTNWHRRQLAALAPKLSHARQAEP